MKSVINSNGKCDLLGERSSGLRGTGDFCSLTFQGSNLGDSGGEVGDAIKADDANPTRIQNKRLLGRYARTTAFN